MEDDVEWRPVPGFEARYKVSDRGEIKVCGDDAMGRTRYAGHVLMAAISRRGYYFVSLFRGDGTAQKNVLVHRIVAAAFIGPCKKRLQVNHKNGDKRDNRVANLEYCTPSQNYRHALEVLNFQPPRGATHWKASLTEQDVIAMRIARASGESVKDIAERLGMRMCRVSMITRGNLWRHVVPHSYLEVQPLPCGDERPK